jgi:hypothetical protein
LTPVYKPKQTGYKSQYAAHKSDIIVFPFLLLVKMMLIFRAGAAMLGSRPVICLDSPATDYSVASVSPAGISPPLRIFPAIGGLFPFVLSTFFLG